MYSDVLRIEIFSLGGNMKLIKLRKLKKHTRLRKLAAVKGLMKPFARVTETVTSAGKSRL